MADVVSVVCEAAAGLDAELTCSESILLKHEQLPGIMRPLFNPPRENTTAATVPGARPATQYAAARVRTDSQTQTLPGLRTQSQMSGQGGLRLLPKSTTPQGCQIFVSIARLIFRSHALADSQLTVRRSSSGLASADQTPRGAAFQQLHDRVVKDTHEGEPDVTL